MRLDLRKSDASGVIERVSSALDVQLNLTTRVDKRRSIGARTSRGTWVRIEVRPLAKIIAQGQLANGMEAAELLHGIAKPAWHSAASWRDTVEDAAVMWRADEVEFVTASPIRSRGSLREAPDLPDAWWTTFNSSLDNLMRQRTTRVATPDTETITQALVNRVIKQAFPNQVDSTITDEEWVPAHADLNWANITGPDCWILDWEDHGLAPRGLDAATLWVTSLAVPALAERVFHERRKDLESRSGKLMALFHSCKILNDSSARESPLFQPVLDAATKLVADLRVS
ncbi:hypothetical protein JOF56_000837 [Kibdelosporangium banguiense]|uniref:Aminoglycoside phosphotransferase domain-containing protein n=1 Tax=Kibdelosporangium banguiense TaxID=1365924 RepID=A0ABS4T7R7_9PSEU|nr:phosphotransferase [Kibdelosporangium banguiense]MBP2320452.1 hypothetical protein [Kibdelosporangium banguiense]